MAPCMRRFGIQKSLLDRAQVGSTYTHTHTRLVHKSTNTSPNRLCVNMGRVQLSLFEDSGSHFSHMNRCLTMRFTCSQILQATITNPTKQQQQQQNKTLHLLRKTNFSCKVYSIPYKETGRDLNWERALTLAVKMQGTMPASHMQDPSAISTSKSYLTIFLARRLGGSR